SVLRACSALALGHSRTPHCCASSLPLRSLGPLLVTPLGTPTQPAGTMLDASHAPCACNLCRGRCGRNLVRWLAGCQASKPSPAIPFRTSPLRVDLPASRA